MINILLPVAGHAKRFLDVGCGTPKPLIPVDGVPMIKLALDSLVKDSDRDKYRLIFIVRDDHCINHGIVDAFKSIFKGWEVEAAIVDHVTKGTLCSCLVAEHLIRPDEPLVIYTPDVCFEADFDVERNFVNGYAAGALLTFKANSPDHSYVSTGPSGLATKTAEKSVISNDALVGVYAFRTGADFLKYAKRAVDSGLTVNGEYYVAPMYNYLIEDGLPVSVHRTSKMHVLGTPADLTFYETHVARYGGRIKLAVCCDHSGYAMKEALMDVMASLDVESIDFGAHSHRDSDHHDSLRPCANYVLTNPRVIGIATCMTGQGFNIAANKVAGIRSALVTDARAAEMGRRHNAANFFCLPASVQKSELRAIVMAIVGNSFDGGRHATRIRKVASDPLFIS